MKQQHWLLGEVAEIVKVRPHQLTYALRNKLVEEPRLRIGGRRVFSAEDIERLRRFFHQPATVAAKE